jgi:hypothetical protein
VLDNFILKDRQFQDMIHRADEVASVELERELSGLAPIITEVILQGFAHSHDDVVDYVSEGNGFGGGSGSSGDDGVEGVPTDSQGESQGQPQNASSAQQVQRPSTPFQALVQSSGAESENNLTQTNQTTGSSESNLNLSLFDMAAPTIFPLVAELVVVNSSDVRFMVRELLLRKVAASYTGEGKK